MEFGYKMGDLGDKIHATSVIPAHIKALDVELLVNINHDVSYPLNSPHNRGLHVKIRDNNKTFITELNIEKVATEQELIQAVTDSFHINDEYVMINKAVSGDTFPFDSPVFNLTAINNQSYHGWDDDQQELDDDVDQQTRVFLNEKLRWQVK